MEYVNLGRTGLRVSRVCLGMMSFGKHESREWTLDEPRCGADRPPRGRGRHYVLRHRRRLQRRPERGHHRQVVAASCSGCARSTWSRPRSTARRCRARTAAAYPASTSWPRSTRHSSGSSSTTSTSTRSTGGTTARRSTRRWMRSTTWSEQGRRATSAPAACTRGSSRRRSRSHHYPFVSMQNHYNLIYREEEREMIPQCIDQGVGVIPWSPLARGLLAGNRTREGERLTTRANTDAFGDMLYTARHRLRRDRARDAGRRRERRADRPGRARVAPAATPGSPRRSSARPSSSTSRMRSRPSNSS